MNRFLYRSKKFQKDPPQVTARYIFIFITLTVFVLLSIYQSGKDDQIPPAITFYDPNETTFAIISGDVTPDGRPLMWKSRDKFRDRDQEFYYADDGEYSYVTINNAGNYDEAYGGVNSVGFAIGNSTSFNLADTVDGDDDDGIIIKLALQTCRTVADFVAILDSTNETGRTLPSNYGVFDTEGTVAMFESSAGDYVRFDADNEEDAPDGILVRANFSYTGGDSDRAWSQYRHDRAYELLIAAIEEDALTPDYIMKTGSRDISLPDLDPYPLPLDSAYAGENWPKGFLPAYLSINRNSTRSLTIVHGVQENENPLLATVYAVVSQPVLGVPVPLWVRSESTPVELDGDSTSSLCDLSIQFERYVYNPLIHERALNTVQLDDGEGGGLFNITNPVIDSIFARTYAVMERWREELPDGNTMAAFQNAQAEYAYEQLQGWRGKTLHRVPDDYETINEAIMASAHGDTVLILPGVYEAPILFSGRNIVVGSLFLTTGDIFYIDSTIIDGNQNGRSGAVIDNGETRDAILTGLTIRNTFTGFGGGIYCNGTSPTLSHLVIRDNISNRRGGGIYSTRESNPLLINVTIVNNTAAEGGGAIGCFDNNSTVTTISSIIRNNEPSDLQYWLPISYSNIEGGYPGAGIIDTDPIFIDYDQRNLHLSKDSPCLDAGDPTADSDPDGTSTDMGAFYLHQRDIEVDRLDITFEDIQTGTRDSAAVQITNRGMTTLQITGQSIFPSENPFFIGLGGGDFELESDSMHTIWLVYSPNQQAEHIFALIINSNDPDEEEVQVNLMGSALGINLETGILPLEFGITDVYPNPFTQSVTITYSLAQARDIRFGVYNNSGREVIVLTEGYKAAGGYVTQFEAGRLPSGVYIAQLKGGGKRALRKLLLIK